MAEEGGSGSGGSDSVTLVLPGAIIRRAIPSSRDGSFFGDEGGDDEGGGDEGGGEGGGSEGGVTRGDDDDTMKMAEP